jgi:hypothetical protein
MNIPSVYFSMTEEIISYSEFQELLKNIELEILETNKREFDVFKNKCKKEVSDALLTSSNEVNLLVYSRNFGIGENSKSVYLYVKENQEDLETFLNGSLIGWKVGRISIGDFFFKFIASIKLIRQVPQKGDSKEKDDFNASYLNDIKVGCKREIIRSFKFPRIWKGYITTYGRNFEDNTLMKYEVYSYVEENKHEIEVFLNDLLNPKGWKIGRISVLDCIFQIRVVIHIDSLINK